MSAATRQRTCAACGDRLDGDVDLEFLVDDVVRMVAVHPGHTTRAAPTGAPRPGTAGR